MSFRWLITNNIVGLKKIKLSKKEKQELQIKKHYKNIKYVNFKYATFTLMTQIL